MVFGRRKSKPREETWEERLTSLEREYQSREYKIFRQEGGRKISWYERLAKLAGKILEANPGKNESAKLEGILGFIEYDITPANVFAMFILTIIGFTVLGIALGISGSIPLIGSLLIAALGLLLGYFFYKYPESQLKVRRIKASSMVVLAILYMVVSMRISPNLERALRFTAGNVKGELAYDMRKLIWDIEMKKYYSASDAMDDYIVRWKPENEEFAEALRLIRNATKESPEKIKITLDEALDVVLDGTKTRMKHYAQNLQTPVLVIHMMGIVLPVLGSIMAPLVAGFMANLVSPIHFVLGYDIILPVVIIWFIQNTLNKRPVTFSAIDIRHHPDLPRQGSFKLKGRDFPAFPLALIILIAFLILPTVYFTANPEILLGGVEGRRDFPLYSVVMIMLILTGVAFSIGIYFILSNYQQVRIQDEIHLIEGEFELALFQLGNRISGGTPTELAIERSLEDVKDLKIAGLFRKTLQNIRMLGLTLEAALFDKTYGSLRFYPSELIRNIMYTIIDTAKRGVSYAAEGMIRVSRYLQSIRETQEYLRDILSETVSSMKFQAYILTPVITGLVASMAYVIIKILGKLGQYLETFSGSEAGLFPNFAQSFGLLQSSMSPEIFQMIVGVYLLEVIIILMMFLTKIEYGENRSKQLYSTGIMLIVAFIIFFIITITTNALFVDIIDQAVESLLT